MTALPTGSPPRGVFAERGRGTSSVSMKISGRRRGCRGPCGGRNADHRRGDGHRSPAGRSGRRWLPQHLPAGRPRRRRRPEPGSPPARCPALRSVGRSLNVGSGRSSPPPLSSYGEANTGDQAEKSVVNGSPRASRPSKSASRTTVTIVSLRQPQLTHPPVLVGAEQPPEEVDLAKQSDRNQGT